MRFPAVNGRPPRAQGSDGRFALPCAGGGKGLVGLADCLAQAAFEERVAEGRFLYVPEPHEHESDSGSESEYVRENGRRSRRPRKSPMTSRRRMATP